MPETKIKRKVAFFIIALALFAVEPAIAQSKQKAEKEFLEQLNSIVKNSPTQHWGYEGKMTIDSAFAISAEGILSVTVKYTTDTSVIRARMEAPVSEIKGIAYDLYLILQYMDEVVTVFQSGSQGRDLKETGKSHLFHIGEPKSDGYGKKEKLQKALDNLLKYYQ